MIANVIGDGIVAALLLLWLLYLIRLNRALRKIGKDGTDMMSKMQEFTAAIAAGQQAARKLSENMVMARSQLEEEQRKVGFIVTDLQNARDELRREIARARQKG